MVSCRVVRTEVIKKHSPVVLTLAGDARGNVCETLRKPKAIPVQRVIGCPRHFDCTSAGILANGIVDQDSLSQAYKEFAHLAEQQVMDTQGMDIDRAGARSKPPKVVKVSAMAINNGFPRADADARTWRQMQMQLGKWMVLYANGRFSMAAKSLVQCLAFTPCNGKPDGWADLRC